MKDQNLRLPQVVELTGLKRSTVWKYMKTQGFPKQYKIAPKVSVWKLSEVEEWLEKQMVQVA